jgi:geranylgeranyl diphosphate synthase type I
MEPVDQIQAEIDRLMKDYLDSKSLPLYDMLSYHLGIHGLDPGLTISERAHGILLQIAVETLGGDPLLTLPAAMSIEMVNAFCEIHDDVQSGNPTRNGQDSLWWVWGPAQAINAGDGMHSIARISLLNLDRQHFSDRISHAALSFLDKGALVTFEGRYRDLEMQEKIDTSVTAYLEMAGQKTGALYGSALSMAAGLSGLSSKACEGLFQSGHLIGQAKQIKLDMDQIWGSDSNQKIDFLNKKKLFPVIAGLEKATPSQKRKLGDVYFKRVLENSDLDAVLDVLSDLGGKEPAELRYTAAKDEALFIVQENFPNNRAGNLIDYLEKILEE